MGTMFSYFKTLTLAQPRPNPMPPSWIDLPSEIQLQIACNLSIPDLARFYAASSLCRSLAGEARRLAPTPRRQPPWLMLPSASSDDLTVDFYPLSGAGGKRYRIPVPDPPPVFRRVCIGAGHGWVVTAGDGGGVHLLNPVTGSQIELPGGIASFHEMILKRISRNDLCYPKAILSSNPSNGNYTVILLAYISYEPSLAFIRSGEEEWTLIPGQANFKEMAYHNGLLYTATKEGVIEAWDLNGPSPANSMVVFPDQRLYSWRQRSLMYLASSSWGDLLQMVLKTYDLCYGEIWLSLNHLKVWWEMDPDGLHLNVYKVDFARRKLIRIDCLGDQALFLGGNHSLCLSSVEVPEVRGNCIYFSDDCFDLPPSKDHEHLGLYNLKEGSFEALFPFDIRSSWQRPIWIRPSFA